MGSPFRALRSRNYRLFFIGQGISLIGSWMTRLASAWLVYRLTNSPFLLGLVTFASQSPAFFVSPLAGVLLDRWDRRRVLITAQALLMCVSLSLAALTLSGTVTVPWIIGLAVVQGLVTAVEIPTRQSFVVRMLDDRADLSNAIALNSSIFNSARLIGPAIAGAIVAAVGEGMCFLLDGLSYIAVIAGLVAMRVPPDDRADSTTDVWQEFRDGWAYLASHAPIHTLLTFLALVGVFGAPYTALAPMIAADLLGGGPRTLGFLVGASGVGALVSAVMLVLRKSVVGLGTRMTIAVGTFGVGCVALALSSSVWISMVLMAVTGFGLMTQVVSTNTMVQTLVDDEKRGRVMSFYTIALLGSSPVGSLLGGALAARIGVQATLAVSGVSCLLAAWWFRGRLPAIRSTIRARYVELGLVASERQ